MPALGPLGWYLGIRFTKTQMKLKKKLKLSLVIIILTCQVGQASNKPFLSGEVFVKDAVVDDIILEQLQ